ncbi:tRNA (adenosine(37)-N6)-threonylcarbamoyltransferase complex transferase subunit TsaD [Candidatus Woesearchaeota archaeon]|nr:tRNA (adenosine(37)-N6)-threonylcarbamoyltransferase complex transferase subunit TsaD [Candidatus Woesearchaeota archaeon]
MFILGIECTAHTFGIGIVSDTGKVLANIIDSYTSPEAGMIPHKVAEHHRLVAEEVLQKAFQQAQQNVHAKHFSWDDISFVAYSAGPGLDPSLLAGYEKAKEWSKKYQKKLIGVNHPAAHLSIGKIIHKLKDPCYLYVSGVNTQVIVQANGKYHVLGETLDNGLGNMLDKFGRLLGLGFPAGPKIEELAKKGKYVELPYAVKGMDVSFSGILTKVEQLFKQKKASAEDLCFSLQETCFAMMTEVTERAMAHAEKKELLLVGGVGANQRFCTMLDIMCKERGAKFFKVPLELVRDNGAMIAWEGFLRKDTSGDIEINPHWRINEV